MSKNRLESMLFEAIQTHEGRFVVRRGDSKENLFTLEFGDAAQNILQGSHQEIAAAMIEAGVQVVGRVMEQQMIGFSSSLIH